MARYELPSQIPHMPLDFLVSTAAITPTGSAKLAYSTSQYTTASPPQPVDA